MSSFSLTPEQLALLPDDADVKFYEENGCYISKEGVVPDALIDAADDGSQRFYRGERDAVLPFDTGFSNSSGLPRLSYAVHLQDGPNHYRPFRTAQGREIHLFDEKLCRTLPDGDPDFSDPAVFPTVWSEKA